MGIKRSGSLYSVREEGLEVSWRRHRRMINVVVINYIINTTTYRGTTSRYRGFSADCTVQVT
jgi:hypothetical protein